MTHGMRIIVLAVVGVVVMAAAVRGADEDTRRVETDHLVIEWSEGVPAEAVEETKVRGEGFYGAVANLLGHEPPAKITVLLNGPAERPDGSWGYPRVDGFGRIHLFQFSPDIESYFNALAHEMVHVFRLMRPNKDWFFEEGFAEFVALRVDPSLEGFPWYGSSVEVVTGQWLASGKGIPLATLRDNHKALNMPCKAQSYSLRSSFFAWLGETFGDESVLAMATDGDANNINDYKQYFGDAFSELAEAWRNTVMNEYRAIEDVDALTQQYLESPIKYMPVCEAGKQF